MTHLPRPRPRLILVKKGALLKDKIALYRRKYKIYWHILSTFWKYPFLVDIFQHLLLHLTPDTFAKQLHCTAPQSNWWGKMISLKIKRWSSWADVSSCPQGASLPFPSCATAPNTTPALTAPGNAQDRFTYLAMFLPFTVHSSDDSETSWICRQLNKPLALVEKDR